MRFDLQKVKFIPTNLSPGVLYVSNKYSIAVHLCACGCGTKIRTPLGPTEWSVKRTPKGPSLYPSVGNWQEPCQSHYWIRRGEVTWADPWSQEQIAEGRRNEDQRRAEYFESRGRMRQGLFGKILGWARGLVARSKP